MKNSSAKKSSLFGSIAAAIAFGMIPRISESMPILPLRIEIVGPSPADFFYDKNDVNKIKQCRVRLPDGVSLGTIGLTDADMRAGVSCVVGSFGKGNPSYLVIYGKSFEAGRNFLVLTLKAGAIKRSQVLEASADYLLPVLPGGIEGKDYPQFRKSTPALIRYGQGDRGWIYFLNRKTGLFEETAYHYPPCYD